MMLHGQICKGERKMIEEEGSGCGLPVIMLVLGLIGLLGFMAIMGGATLF